MTEASARPIRACMVDDNPMVRGATGAIAQLRLKLGAVLFLVLAALSATQAAAQYERLGFGQFKHTKWTADNGVPPGISQIAQTPDGWLWLATVEGLYRFDGITFELIPAPVGSRMERAPASSVFVSRSGELWVGYDLNGGIAVYRQGRLYDMSMPHPPRGISSIAQSPDGALWATWGGAYDDDRLFRRDGNRWEDGDALFGLPAGYSSDLCITADGAVWLTPEDNRLAVLMPGERRFRTSQDRYIGLRICAVDRQGQLWLSDKHTTRLVIGPDGKPPAKHLAFPSPSGFPLTDMTFDASGTLWGGTTGGGIYYVPHATKSGRTIEDGLHRFTAADGLTSDGVYSIFIDREDNVWIASRAGLDRFRRSGIFHERAIPNDASEELGLARAGHEVYIGTVAGLFQLSPGQPRKLAQNETIWCGARDRGFWSFDDTHIFRWRDGKRTAMPRDQSYDVAGACAEDRSGRLWVPADGGGGLIWHDDTGWHVPPRPLPQWDQPLLAATPSGEVAYTATGDGDLVRLVGDKVTITKLARFNAGTVTNISAGIRDIFISGNEALLRIRGDRVDRLDGRRFPWATRLVSVVQTPRGDTWLKRSRSISMVATADLDRAFENPAARFDRTEFNLRDGLTPAQGDVLKRAQMAVGEDGRIWLLGQSDVMFIDPERLYRDTAPPHVVIRSLTSAGKLFRDPPRLSLMPGTRSLDIAFTALSLANPERLQFRYRLKGVDDDWVDPGTRRVASYASLGPGNYRFQVIAANGDGAWNKTGATLEFEIRPTFFQSWPFRLLCALALAGLLWLAYSLRLRAVTSQIRGRMAERTAERARIARELHDTLLQSVQALTLRFQLAVDYLSKDEPARPVLEEAIDQADQVIAEGRDRVRDLRTFEESDIEKVLCDIVARQAFAPDVETSVVSLGTPRPLDPLAFDEIVRIANEAIFNIRRHAGASKVAVEIDYGKNFTIKVADDGVGIDPAILSGGARKGHFGLPGMRERASKLRGDLEVHAGAGGGTELVLTIPGRIAYKAARPGFFARFRSRA